MGGDGTNRKFIVNEQLRSVAQEVLDMLETDDGKSFEIKKADILKALDNKIAVCEDERNEKRNSHHAMRGERRDAF